MNPLKYTDRRVFTYNHTCLQSQVHFTLNGQPLTGYNVVYFSDGLCFIEFAFGTLKPGDILAVSDDCGSTPYSVTVSDDYVYVEVPAGKSHIGNNIPPGDATPPYTRLSTPVAIGQCEPIKIGAHGLHGYGLFVSTNQKGKTTQIGQFLINGKPLTAVGHTIAHVGYATPVAYTIGPTGSLTFNGPVRLTSQQFYSGQTPIAIEYRHNGVSYSGDLDMSIGAMTFRYISNTGFSVQKATYTSQVSQKDFIGDYSQSIFKITYDGQYFRAYVDNVLVDELERFVIFDAKGGSISNPGVLPYGSSVTFSPTLAGSGWVGVLVDGVLYTRQQFSIADDLYLNPTIINATCSGVATGQISLTSTGGKSPLLYNINGGAYSSANTFTGLAPSTYTVGVRDASGCTANRTVTVNQPLSLSLGINTQTNVTCAGKTDGAVTLNISGGTGPYQFSRDGTNYSAPAGFSGLAAGTYTFTAKDSNGCTTSVSTTLTNQSTFSPTIVSQQNIACNGSSTGVITLTTTGTPIGLVQYSLNGGTPQTGQQFTALGAGSYTVTAKDNLCAVSLSVVLSQPPALMAVATISQAVTCFGGTNGTIAVAGTGGTPTYQYATDGQTYQAAREFMGLGVGNYKYWVKDANGCVATTPILTVAQPSALQIAITVRQDALCFGGATGSLAVGASGGTAPYTYTRTGSNFSSSGQFTALLAGAYTLQSRDANGCPASVSTTIGQPSPLQGGVGTLQAVMCSGGSDGVISLSATGGTGPYGYAKDAGPFGNGNIFSGLSEGGYLLNIRDANGCTLPVSATVGYKSRLLISIAAVRPVACYGENTGGITASATGSTAVGTLLYSIDGVSYQPSAQFTGVGVGSYTLRLKDDLCQVSQSFTVGQPSALQATASVVQAVGCWGGSSGLTRVSASGGIMPYRYSANGTVYQTSPDFSSLPVGSYTYQVSDANGCSLMTVPVSVSQPTPLQLGVSTRSDVRCHEGADGSVSLTATGGTPGYRFALPGDEYASSAAFTGLRAGGYTARVQDAQGCLTTLPVVVGQPLAPFTLTVTNRTALTCYQNNGGRFTVGGSGGTAPYQYALNNGPLGSVDSFTSLAAGTYLLSGKDAQGCTVQLSGQTLTQPDEIVLSLLRKVEVDCEYYTRGEAQLNAVGGNGAYIFSLTGQDRRGNAVNTSPTGDGTFKALAAGNYLVTARDGAGCTGEYRLAVSARNPAIRFSTSVQPPAACQQSTGQIFIENVTGGRPPYSYGISTQSTLSANAQFTNLVGGSYIVTVADSLCAYSQTARLDVAGSLTADYTLTPRDCRTPNADLQLTRIQGGSGSYLVSLNSGPLTPIRTFPNLSPGIYAIRLEDVPLSCPTILSLEVLPQNGAGLRLTDRQAVRCWNGSDGQLTVTAEAMTGPFRYAINGGGFSDEPRFTGLKAGQYRVVVQNRLGCIDSMRVLITQPPQLDIVVVPKANNCFGDQTGAVTTAASGGVSPYTYSTDGTNYVPATTLENLRAGSYTVRVRDANGCVTPRLTTIQQPPLLTLKPVYSDTVRCFGESNGRVRLMADGGTPAYRYSIDSVAYGADMQFPNLKAGAYRFWVQDSKQCRTQVSLSLSEPGKLQLRLLSQMDPLCYGDSSGKAQVLATGGNGGYKYDTNSGRYQSTGQFTGLSQANYGFRVTDRQGCSDTTARIRLTWPAPITSSFVTRQPRCFGEANGQITVSLQGGTSPYQATVTNPPATSPIFTFTGLIGGPYTLPFTDGNGCRHQVPLTLEQPTALSALTTIKPNDCFGDQTGAITVAGQGGTPPYRYSFDADTTLQTGGRFSKLVSGNYLPRVVDANGCRLTQPALVRQPPVVTLQALYADTVRCFGETNGRVQLIAGGGVSGYRYALDTTRYYADPAFGALKAGQYQFWVKDQNGCRQSASLAVTEPALMRLSLTDQKNPLCAGEANGIIGVAANGGNSGYTYWLDNRLSQRTGRFTGLTQAEYTLKAVDRRGCEDTIRRVVMTWPRPMGAALQTLPPRCFGEANGAIRIRLTGGVVPYSGTLVGSGGLITGTDSLRYTNLPAGTYEVAVADQNGCALRLPATVALPERLLPLQLGDSAIVCKGQVVTLDSRNPTQQVSWSLNGQPLSIKPLILATEPGLYRVSVKNATGCETTGQFKLINTNKALNADFLMTTQAFVGDTVYALNTSVPTADFVKWIFPTETYLVEKNQNRAGFVAVSPGIYTIRMLASKEECENSKQRDIQIFYRKDVGQTDPLLGYQSQINFGKVVVYPNPNFGKFSLQIDLSQISDVEVTIIRSLNSVLVYKAEVKAQSNYLLDINLKNFVQDVYIIVIRAGTSVYKQKVLIMN